MATKSASVLLSESETTQLFAESLSISTASQGHKAWLGSDSENNHLSCRPGAESDIKGDELIGPV